METGDLICSESDFCITFDRLTEQNWFLFAMGLKWDLNNFFPAYYAACKLIGLDEVTFQITHK